MYNNTCQLFIMLQHFLSRVGWEGFALFLTDQFFVFQRGRCVVSAMDETDSVDKSWTEITSNFGPVEAFTSFSEDLRKLQDNADTGDLTGSHDGCDLFAGHDTFQHVETGSCFSPTTIATTDAYADVHAQRVQGMAAVDTAESQNSGVVRFDAALSVALNSTTEEQPKHIWETGIWKYIFSDDDSGLDFGVWGQPMTRPSPALWGIETDAVELSSSSTRKRSNLHACNFMDVVSFKPDVPWPDQREADLQRSINLWLAVTSKWSDSCSLVLKIAEMRNEAEVFSMLAHVFAGRAPVTIRKRGTSILKLCDSLEANHLGSFPMDELTLYRFLCDQRSQGAPSSRLRGTLQAIAFCRHVLDMQELQPVLDSKRCSGVSRDACPKERKQASPLTVEELRKLHSVVDHGDDAWDAVFAGAALLCCYCRGRWGDLMRSESAFIDFDDDFKPAFIETRTGRHKTMSAQLHRHHYLPMVAPVKGIHGCDWASPWERHRKALNLCFPPEGLIMPAPDQNGMATQRPLESGECGKWLRRLLGVESSTAPGQDRRVSSHSLKCTMLSYAAKRGLSVPDRLMLGYHSSQMHMAMVYSRDGAAASLLLLEKLIDEIARGKFRPDSTRSGRLIDSPSEKPGPQEHEGGTCCVI